MRVSDLPLRLAVLTGCGSGVGAWLAGGCTWGETAFRAVVGLAAGWALSRAALVMLRQARRVARAAAPPIDLAERPLSDAIVAEAKQEATESPMAAQDAAQIVSRMMKQP